MPMNIGTSGWQYRDWRGGLYPPEVPQRRWLEQYAQRYLSGEQQQLLPAAVAGDIRELAASERRMTS